MKSILILLASIAFNATANVYGLGVYKANAADKTVNQSQFHMKEDPKTITLKITGMTCAGCASHIHTALSKTEGVINDEVKYPGDVAIIKYDASKISEKEIIAAIEKAGYKAEIIKETTKKKTL
ncbi:MAG: cation transporter [Ferruginibacter sp.]|nr:cation transporter [Ferruginibacter sp.]